MGVVTVIVGSIHHNGVGEMLETDIELKIVGGPFLVRDPLDWAKCLAFRILEDDLNISEEDLKKAFPESFI